MFAIDKRKYEVRDRIERDDWMDFELDDFGLVTLIYEMNVGESLKMIDHKERYLNVVKTEETGLTIVHKDFIVYNAYIEVISKTAYIKNDNVSICISLADSRILEFSKEGDH